MNNIIKYFGNLYFKNEKNKEIDKSKIKKIAIIKAGAIGDVLMSTPFLRALRETFLDSQITYYTSKWSARVLTGNTNLTNVVELENDVFYSKKIFKILKSAKTIRKEKYDLVFVLDKSYLAGLFAWLCDVPVRIGFDRKGEGFTNTHNINYGPVMHEIDYYLSLLKWFSSTKIKNKKIELVLSESDLKFAKKIFAREKLIKSKTIAIAPGGGKNPGELEDIRRMPVSKYVKLCELLVKHEWKIILIGGPTDIEICDTIVEQVGVASVINTAGQSSLKESAALISQCSLFICNDSGPMHVGASTNTRIISLFGPTNPKRKAPIGSNNVAIWKDKNIYSEDYELYGVKAGIGGRGFFGWNSKARSEKKNWFFGKLGVEEIIERIPYKSENL